MPNSIANSLNLLIDCVCFCALQTSESSFGSERLRHQDLRRRHVSAGVVLGLNPHQVAAAGRVQTTLNNAVPLWGSDPLAQEIEGLLDSAPSSVNDSVMSRSQSVPLHRMLQQYQSQGITRCETDCRQATVNQIYGGVLVGQGYATMSQPSTPFGCGRNFTYNASATSSPYSYTATPVPAEWNDFSSHANNGKSQPVSKNACIRNLRPPLLISLMLMRQR